MSPEWDGVVARVAVESSVRVVALAVAVEVILLVARARSGGVRHAAGSAVLGAMLLMPVLPYCVPAIAVPVTGGASALEAVWPEGPWTRRLGRLWGLPWHRAPVIVPGIYFRFRIRTSMPGTPASNVVSCDVSVAP